MLKKQCKYPPTSIKNHCGIGTAPEVNIKIHKGLRITEDAGCINTKYGIVNIAQSVKNSQNSRWIHQIPTPNKLYLSIHEDVNLKQLQLEKD